MKRENKNKPDCSDSPLCLRPYKGYAGLLAEKEREGERGGGEGREREGGEREREREREIERWEDRKPQL